MLGRSLTNLLLLVLAGCVLVFSFAVEVSAVVWIALGVGCATVIVSMAGFALSDRGAGQRTLDIVLALTGGWLVVSSRTLPEAAQKWLCFGAAAMIAGLALVGLIAREVALAQTLGRLRAEETPAALDEPAPPTTAIETAALVAAAEPTAPSPAASAVSAEPAAGEANGHVPGAEPAPAAPPAPAAEPAPAPSPAAPAAKPAPAPAPPAPPAPAPEPEPAPASFRFPLADPQPTGSEPGGRQ